MKTPKAKNNTIWVFEVCNKNFLNVFEMDAFKQIFFPSHVLKEKSESKKVCFKNLKED